MVSPIAHNRLSEGHRVAADAPKAALTLRSLHINDDSHALNFPFVRLLAFSNSA